MAPLGPRDDRHIGYSMWMWPPAERVGGSGSRPPAQLRIGDTERDEAVTTLGDHFAAGRLTREEFDERVDKAMQARFEKDLVPLFADLPAKNPPAAPARPRHRPQPAMQIAPLFWMIPLLLVGLVLGAFVLREGWPLWGVFWLLVITRASGRRHFPGGRRPQR